MTQIENNEAWRTMLFIWDSYTNILRPFLIKLYNLKFGENWQDKVPYDGYVDRTIKDEYKVPSDLSKADANKLLSYMIHIKKNNTYEANRFYSQNSNAWNEVSDKPLLINKFSNAVRYRNYFFHANGDKIQRDFYEVTFDEVTSTVLGILKPFDGNKMLCNENGESYYSLAVKLADGLKQNNLYSIKEALHDMEAIFPGIKDIDTKQILADNGVTIRDEHSVSFPSHNEYLSILRDIRNNYITCDKIRKKLSVSKSKLSNEKIKQICVQKTKCKAIYGDSDTYSIIAYASAEECNEAVEIIRANANKKSGKRALVILMVLLLVAAIVVGGVFVANKLMNPKTTYENDKLKQQVDGEPLNYNIKRAVWKNDKLYFDIIVDNFSDDEQLVSKPTVHITAYDGEKLVYEMKMQLDEEWNISPDGNKILKKVEVDDKKVKETFDDGIRDLKFDIAVTE